MHDHSVLAMEFQIGFLIGSLTNKVLYILIPLHGMHQ